VILSLLAPTTLTHLLSWHTHAHAGATLLSFVVALVHFITEVLIFKTMSIKGAATPMAIAGELSSGPQQQRQQQHTLGLIGSQGIQHAPAAVD
jgi:hypothetical protein